MRTAHSLESSSGPMRALVLGASGWFGRTALDLLFSQGIETCAIGGPSTSHIPIYGPIEIKPWSEDLVADFQPNTVLDFSFLTKDKLLSMPLAEFKETNRFLTSRLLKVATMSSVRRILYSSSGAAFHSGIGTNRDFNKNPYGFLKREAEDRLSKLVRSSDGSKSLSILRSWSVSGIHVSRPLNYLFSSVVHQALKGEISLTSPTKVFRRYVDVSDAIWMSLLNFQESGVSILETGGELVEALELAELVRSLVNSSARVSVNRNRLDSSDNYFSDGTSWLQATKRFGFTPITLEEQVLKYASYISLN